MPAFKSIFKMTELLCPSHECVVQKTPIRNRDLLNTGLREYGLKYKMKTMITSRALQLYFALD